MIELSFIILGYVLGLASFLIFAHISDSSKTVWRSFTQELPPNDVMIRVMGEHIDLTDSVVVDYKIAECWIMKDGLPYYVEGIEPNGKICTRLVNIPSFKSLRWAMWT